MNPLNRRIPLFMPLVMLLARVVAAPQPAAAAGVSVAHPWMRYLLPNLPAAGYMVLSNSGDDDAMLTGAASPDCGMLSLHESKDDSGMAMMMNERSIRVPAHGSVNFAPGGFHLMCMQPRMRVGGAVPVTLIFQDGRRLTIEMPVYGPDSAP